MTIQVPDTLIYEGFQYDLRYEPLKKFVDHHFPGLFEMESTACWRGYEATLQITDDKLYVKWLVGIQGWPLDMPYASFELANTWEPFNDETQYHFEESLNRPKNGREACRNLIKKADDNGLFADWFSGTLRCPFGKLVPHTNVSKEFENGLVFEHKGFSIVFGRERIVSAMITDTDYVVDRELVVKINRGMVVGTEVVAQAI